jgi:amidase
MDAARRSADDDLAFAGVARQAELVRAKEVSPRELVELYLRRIERLDPELNAFRRVFAEQALTEADQAAGRAGAGGDRPLLGVPVAIKDDQGVRGDVLTHGTNAYGEPEREDYELVKRLRTAGAIVLGITRVPELEIFGFTESATGGVTRNPWDVQRTPGGSSGGSGAAVAAGLVPFATASDGAGSIRIPASYCGLFGLKAGRGRVPTAPKPESWHGMSVPGFLTRSVRDSALAYEAVTGQPLVEAAERDPGRLRIAVSTKVPTGFLSRVDGDSRRAVEETAQLLESLGHEVRERDPDYSMSAYQGVLTRYLAGIHDDAHAMPHFDRLEPRTKGMARMGALVRPFVGRARAGEERDARRVNAIFDDHDILLTPVNARIQARVGEDQGRGAFVTLNLEAARHPFTGMWNHLGNPAVSIPVEPIGSGLPVGAQLVAGRGGEATLVSLSRQLEQARPWTDRRPPLS